MDSTVVTDDRSFGRIARAVRWSESQYGQTYSRNRRQPSTVRTRDIYAIVLKNGPSGPELQPNFTDHRYWFKAALPSNMLPDVLAPAVFTTISDPTDELYEWASFTNMAEEWTRGHLLEEGQLVRLTAIYDRTDTETRRYIAFEPPTQPFIWVKIVSAMTHLIPGARWKYTGVEQEETGTGFQDLQGGRTITGILNSIEANNDGVGIEGNGIDKAHLPGTFAMVPIRGEPVVQIWPHAVQLTPGGPITTQWTMQDVNAVDGTCP